MDEVIPADPRLNVRLANLFLRRHLGAAGIKSADRLYFLACIVNLRIGNSKQTAAFQVGLLFKRCQYRRAGSIGDFKAHPKIIPVLWILESLKWDRRQFLLRNNDQMIAL